MLVRTFKGREEDELKFHYVAHTALDVIEERLTSVKSMDCFLGLLYVMEDASVAVYGYQTPSRVKLVLAIVQADTFNRDADIIMVFKAMHMAYQRTLCNPFLRLKSSYDHTTEQIEHLMLTGDKWKPLKTQLDTIARVTFPSTNTSIESNKTITQTAHIAHASPKTSPSTSPSTTHTHYPETILSQLSKETGSQPTTYSPILSSSGTPSISSVPFSADLLDENGRPWHHTPHTFETPT